jgi:hypothetical protein
MIIYDCGAEFALIEKDVKSIWIIRFPAGIPIQHAANEAEILPRSAYMSVIVSPPQIAAV